MTRVLLALCLLASAAAAQSVPADAGREKLLGETLGRDGKPWPGATVRLLFRPLPEREDFGTADRVEVHSDANGQFKAPLLPCCAYSAYACEPQEDGSVVFSQVAEGVLAGTHLVLRKDPAPRLPRPLRIVGIAAWTKAGQSVRVRAVAGTACRQAIEVPLDQDGAGTVPPLPGGTFTVEVVGTDELPIVERRLSDRDLVAPEPLQLPPPVRVRVTVKAEGDSGNALAGAVVRVVATNRARAAVAGTTDAAGACEVLLPGSLEPGAEPGSLMTERQLQADAPGYAIASARVPVVPEAGAWNQKDLVRLATVAARPGHAAGGRVLGADGKPLAGLALLLCTQGSTRVDENSRQGFQVWPRPITTAADGRFALTSLDPDCPFHLIADARSPGLVAPADARAAFPLAPLAVLTRGRGTAERQVELGDLGVKAAAPVLVEVHSPEGPPARNARLEVLASSRIFGAPELPPFHTDRNGRVRALLTAEPQVLLATTGPGQVRTLVLTPGPTAAPPHVVTLEQALSVSGTLVDQDGKPVAGASLSIRQSHARSSNEMGVEERNARQRFNQRGLRGETDEKGRFQLWFLPIPGTGWGIGAYVRGAGHTVGQSGVLRIEQESVDGAELTVTLPEPQGTPESRPAK